MKVFFTFLFLALLTFTGCNSQPVAPNGEPAWVMNPNKGSKMGAVGVAGRTYDQKPSSQRKLAITRALDELSLQMGVEVSLSMNKTETLSNGKANMSMNDQSNYQANNKVSAHIEAIWKNRTTYELYVWMLMD